MGTVPIVRGDALMIALLMAPMSPRGEVHDSVRPGLHRNTDLFQFRSQVDVILGCAYVGIDLCPETLADSEGQDARVPLVPYYDDGALFHTLTDELGCHPLLLGTDHHLFGNLAFFCCFQLCHR